MTTRRKSRRPLSPHRRRQRHRPRVIRPRARSFANGLASNSISRAAECRALPVARKPMTRRARESSSRRASSRNAVHPVRTPRQRKAAQQQRTSSPLHARQRSTRVIRHAQRSSFREVAVVAEEAADAAADDHAMAASRTLIDARNCAKPSDFPYRGVFPRLM